MCWLFIFFLIFLFGTEASNLLYSLLKVALNFWSCRRRLLSAELAGNLSPCLVLCSTGEQSRDLCIPDRHCASWATSSTWYPFKQTAGASKTTKPMTSALSLSDHVKDQRDFSSPVFIHKIICSNFLTKMDDKLATLHAVQNWENPKE